MHKPSLTIAGQNHLKEHREKAFQDKNDDLLGLTEVIDYAMKQRILCLPLKAEFPDPPDAVIYDDSGTPLLSVEVTRVGWQKMTEVLAAAEPEEFVEVTQALCVDKKAWRDRKAAKGVRTGDFTAIKQFGSNWENEAHDGGMMVVEALQAAVKKKQNKIESYRAQVKRVWLFLIDDTFPGGWESVFARPDLNNEIASTCTNAGFERVLLFRFGHGVRELWSRSEANSLGPC